MKSRIRLSHTHNRITRLLELAATALEEKGRVVDGQVQDDAVTRARVDDVVLNIKSAPEADDRGDHPHIFARSYNIVRISMGISGLGYSY